MSVPTLLALAGTALMAVAIFVPFRSSFAAGRGEPDEADDTPQWPKLVEPSATACDVPARLDLIDALATIDSAWAIGVLHHASEDETDPIVRAAIDAALSTSASHSPA